MKNQKDLKELLNRIDHRGYPAYKETKGIYDFESYVLSIDHVQGDPFAAPSKISIHIEGSKMGFDKKLYESKCRQVAFTDALLREFSKRISKESFKAKGSGKSGILVVSKPGQEVLERTALTIDAKTGNVTVRMEVGFPARGRSIDAGQLILILYQILPACIKETLFANAYKTKKDGMKMLYDAVELAEDQEFIRTFIKKEGYVAFVADGACLPRESGISSRPMKDAILFRSPESIRISLELPHYGKISGMGIKEGITLIVGGGYHGKSTLLKALEAGVYNHIKDDGREYVITESSAMKLRAEDGRGMKDTDISLFIQNLPNQKDTKHFSTEDASGSTSQAANVVEAIQCTSKVFLIDEDTSATNFMIRDELMQSVVSKDMEPIIPYIERIRPLYEKWGISTILVAGSSGSYFLKADKIIQMNQYEPFDITDDAKDKAIAFYGENHDKEPDLTNILPSRYIKRDEKFLHNPKNKIKALGCDGISVNHDTIDLHYVEQLVDAELVNGLAFIVNYAKRNVFLGEKTLTEGVEEIVDLMNEGGFSSLQKGNIPGNLAIPRKQEIAAMFCRYRGL